MLLAGPARRIGGEAVGLRGAHRASLSLNIYDCRQTSTPNAVWSGDYRGSAGVQLAYRLAGRLNT